LKESWYKKNCALVLIHWLHILVFSSTSIHLVLTSPFGTSLLDSALQGCLFCLSQNESVSCILSSGRTHHHLVLWVVDFVRETCNLTSSHHFCKLRLEPINNIIMVRPIWSHFSVLFSLVFLFSFCAQEKKERQDETQFTTKKSRSRLIFNLIFSCVFI
jgi:hypothetical protein